MKVATTPSVHAEPGCFVARSAYPRAEVERLPAEPTERDRWHAA